MKKICKNCEHFTRKHWINSDGSIGGEQYGGNCVLLLKVLTIDNSFLVFKESFYVQDIFGCSLFKEEK